MAGLFWQYMSVNNHKYAIWLNYLELQNSFNNSDYFTNLQKPRFQKTFYQSPFNSKNPSVPGFNICKVHNPWIAVGGWHGHMTWSLKLPKNQGEGHQGPKGDESQLGRPHTAATSPSPGQQWRKTNIVFTCACCFLQHPSTCRSLWNHCGYSLPIEILLTTTPHHYRH